MNADDYALRDAAEHRYQNDPVFHEIVDSLSALMNDGKISPDGLRAAVELAACHQNRWMPLYGRNYIDKYEDAPWSALGDQTMRAFHDAGRRMAAEVNARFMRDFVGTPTQITSGELEKMNRKLTEGLNSGAIRSELKYDSSGRVVGVSFVAKRESAPDPMWEPDPGVVMCFPNQTEVAKKILAATKAADGKIGTVECDTDAGDVVIGPGKILPEGWQHPVNAAWLAGYLKYHTMEEAKAHVEKHFPEGTG